MQAALKGSFKPARDRGIVLKLTPQWVRDLDFGIGSEARRRITDIIVVVQFNLEQDAFFLREESAPPIAALEDNDDLTLAARSVGSENKR